MIPEEERPYAGYANDKDKELGCTCPNESAKYTWAGPFCPVHRPWPGQPRPNLEQETT